MPEILLNLDLAKCTRLLQQFCDCRALRVTNLQHEGPFGFQEVASLRYDTPADIQPIAS